MGNPVVHFEIMGKDAKRLRSFYKDAFDWEISGHVTFYVAVDDAVRRCASRIARRKKNDGAG
jgi:predicted enzyme related to lactoylglutathione lyase